MHLFAAAPNAFLFYLAQHARTFGKTVIYEYDFEGGELGAYSPSLTFPPPADAAGGSRIFPILFRQGGVWRGMRTVIRKISGGHAPW